MAVILQGLGVLLEVEVGVPQLAVDGAEDLKVLRSHLDGRFKQGDAAPVVASLAEPLPLQSQIQTR